MILTVFYSHWSPLSDHRVFITFERDARHPHSDEVATLSAVQFNSKTRPTAGAGEEGA